MNRTQSQLLLGITVASQLLGLNSAFAHPSDAMPMTNVGVGSKLVITRDINIPAESSTLVFSGGTLLHPYSEDYLRRTTCMLRVDSANHDRIMAKGTTFVVTYTKKVADLPRLHYGVWELSYKGETAALICSSPPQIGQGVYFKPRPNGPRLEYGVMSSIGQVKQGLSSFARVQLATPKPF